MSDKENKVNDLSEKVWDALNEVDYDPLHPQFKYFDDPVKDKIIDFSRWMLDGCNDKNNRGIKIDEKRLVEIIDSTVNKLQNEDVKCAAITLSLGNIGDLQIQLNVTRNEPDIIDVKSVNSFKCIEE